MDQTFCLQAGPFTVQVDTNITAVQRYIRSHYGQALLPAESVTFIDYQLNIRHGAWYRRLLAPQALFLLNHKQPFKPLPLSQAHAFLEWGLNWSISSSAHHYLIVHAATVEKDGKAVIITAPPGSGKSTLSAYLASQGWRLLSDELALVDRNSLDVYGLARPINLKNQSISLMKQFYPDSQFSTMAHDTHKGTVCLLKPNADSLSQAAIPAQPALLIFVRYDANECCYVEPVSKCKALTELIRNTFNFGTLGEDGFVVAKQLAAQMDAYYIEYNNFADCEQAIGQALARHLQE